MNDLDAVALGFEYPAPGSLDGLGAVAAGLPPGRVRSGLIRFVEEVGRLDPGSWEELHTRTLDLSPAFVPYVGHVVWGESYRRGVFMADLQRAEWEAEVDQAGELPDHLLPVLRYLAITEAPLPDVVEVLPRAVDEMRKDLRRAEPDNPYLHLLDAAAAAVDARLSQGAPV
jgi:nitrate reductase molybdenum cofactor assembly chaperone NarJ/NarW